MDWNIGIVFTG